MNLGQRDADHRMAHLCCEMLVRLQSVGLADDDSYEFPINHEVLRAALGISLVHVSRTLQRLREDHRLSLHNKHVTIPDPERFKAFCFIP